MAHASPRALVDRELQVRTKARGRRGCSALSLPSDFHPWDHLPCLAPAMLRDAALSFPARAAAGQTDISPRCSGGFLTLDWKFLLSYFIAARRSERGPGKGSEHVGALAEARWRQQAYLFSPFAVTAPVKGSVYRGQALVAAG